MALSRWTILDGDTFRLALAGGQLRADYADSAGVTQTSTVDVADGEAEYIPAGGARTYYLATREDATDPWCRIGTLEVESLVDAEEETLKRELADLNTRVSEIEAIQFEVTDPSGTAVKRVDLVRLRNARSRAETRLANYRRKRQGRYPMRLR